MSFHLRNRSRWHCWALGASILLAGCGATATEAQSGCDPNYGGCVPVASDVDCAGGSGNGPAYVQGPVTVTGADIYGLDADHDGMGCES
jgi:hypothetical protein